MADAGAYEYSSGGGLVTVGKSVSLRWNVQVTAAGGTFGDAGAFEYVSAGTSHGDAGAFEYVLTGSGAVAADAGAYEYSGVVIPPPPPPPPPPPTPANPTNKRWRKSRYLKTT